MQEVEASYQAGQISEKDMSAVQKAMRAVYETAKYPLERHTFKTGGHNAVIRDLTACSGDALPYFSGSCETPCMCTDGTECNPQSGGPADFARDYCSTDPNNQF